MRRIITVLTALLVCMTCLSPLSVFNVHAEEYGWLPADERYISRWEERSDMPDAIRIQLAYTAGMHAFQQETVCGDPEHYGYTSEVIELWQGVPFTWNVSELYVDSWSKVNGDIYSQDIHPSDSEEDSFVSWEEYPEGFQENSSYGNAEGDGWEVKRRVYFGSIEFTYRGSEGWLTYDMDLKLGRRLRWIDDDLYKTVRNLSSGQERPYGTDPLILVSATPEQVHLFFRLLEVHYSETPATPPTAPHNVYTDADPNPGEKRFSIPAAVAIVLGLTGVSIWLMNRKKKSRQDDDPEDENPRYEIRIRKDFGDKIFAGDSRAVYAKIVQIQKDGSEKDMNAYTAQIRVQSGSFLQVLKTQYADGYMGAAVYAPLTNDVPDTGTIIFNFKGLSKVHMRFRIGGCMIVTDPATGTERVYHETDKGYWVSADGQAVLDPERVGEWMEQRKRDRAYLDQQKINLEEGKTAFDRELRKIKEDYLAEAAKIDAETKRTLYNLKHFGMAEADPQYLKALAEKRTRMAELEGQAAQRRAAVYHYLYYGAYATKYTTDKAFDVIGSKGGVAGKVGKALYTLAVDQTGAITEAIVEGKDVKKEMAKAALGSVLSVGKDYVGDGAGKFVTIVGGNTVLGAVNAKIDGKSKAGILRETGLGMMKGTFQYSIEEASDALKQLIGAGETDMAMNLSGDILRVSVDQKELFVTALGDLANGAYETVEEQMDEFVERTQKGKKF